jgi:microcin C transport system substrate-binding protein
LKDLFSTAQIRTFCAAILLAVPVLAHAAEPSHGLSKYGDLKYPADFKHFDYANPDAPKGGSVQLATLGTFDNLNPFVLKGVSAAGAAAIYDTLTVNSADEPFSVYGLIAESIEVPDDKRWVIFNLRTEARWHDGVALTAEDVVWTFDTIKSQGHPLYKSYYSSVVKAEALDTHKVKFHFSEGNNGELPLIIGQLSIMPKHFWQDKDFEKTTLEPLLGSGPYKFGKIDPGRSINYERVEDYWAKDLPVKKGHDNFDKLGYDYYRDQVVGLEALKAGDVDFRIEYTSKSWKTAYDFPALNAGHVIKEELEDQRLQRMQAFVFNSRLPKFSDARVRQALGYAFDFEWMNKNLFYGAYQRLTSYFQNSEFMATGLPEGDELAILEKYRDQLPASVFDEVYTPPKNDGSGNIRAQYRKALALFKEAGWEVREGKLTHLASGEIMTIELVIAQPSVEKIGLAYRKTLERLGVDLKVRVVDSSQYEKRVEDFDYELLVLGWSQTRSPGTEQYDYWSSAAADEPGSSNYVGIKNPVIDDLIDLLVAAPDRESLVNATKALDRVLLHNHYVIPQYFGPTYRVAYWNKFSRPEISPTNLLGFSTWWVDPEKAAKLP